MKCQDMKCPVTDCAKCYVMDGIQRSMKETSLRRRKDVLKDLHKQITSLQGEMLSIIRPYVEDINHDLWYADFICVPTWDCEKSPVGWCVYDKEKDPAWDSCFFCGEPYERK